MPEELERLDFFTALPISSSIQLPFSQPAVITSSKWASALNEQLQAWVEQHASAPDAMEKYKRFQESLSQTIDFDDLRVRDIDERQQISLYMKTEQNVTLMKEQLKVSLQNNAILRLRCSELYTRDQNLAEVQQLLRNDSHAKAVVLTNKPGSERVPSDDSRSTRLDGLTEPMSQNLRDMEALRDQMKPQWLQQWGAQQGSSSQQQ